MVAVPAGQPTDPADGESVAERNNRIATPRPPMLTHVPTATHIPTIYNGGPTTVPPVIVDAPTTPPPPADPNPPVTTSPAP
ncbi:hypothetical protein ACQPW3_28895 [Actinosynnema sp. CA-248983]